MLFSGLSKKTAPLSNSVPPGLNQESDESDAT
jgi:hypothetical protein